MKAHFTPVKPPPPLFYGVAVGALFAEVAAVLAMSDAETGLLPALGLHFLSIALVGFWGRLARQRDKRERFSIFLVPATIVAGPFGTAICLLAAVVYLVCRKDAVTPSEWIEGLFEQQKDRESERLYERITLGLDNFESSASVEPFRDILTGGSVVQKQMAVAKIARYFRPQFAPLLMQAANDLNAAVRVQAATALAKIERDFMARYIRLENQLKDLPDSNPAKLQLAELYDEYAHAGLLDDNNRQVLRDKAIQVYEACIAEKNDAQWSIRLARLYMRQDQPEKARTLLEPLAKQDGAPREAMHWYMEALFRTKRFDDLRRLARSEETSLRLKGKSASTNAEIEDLLVVWQSQKIDDNSEELDEPETADAEETYNAA